MYGGIERDCCPCFGEAHAVSSIVFQKHTLSSNMKCPTEEPRERQSRPEENACACVAHKCVSRPQNHAQNSSKLDVARLVVGADLKDLTALPSMPDTFLARFRMMR